MRFVILHHLGDPARPAHYDLMLQCAEGRDDNERVLKTFATPGDVLPGSSGEAERLKLLPDHRRAYLTYAGPLTGKRGRVQRVDEGTFELLPPLVALAEALCASASGTRACGVRFAGRTLAGRYELRHLGQGQYSFKKVD